jgi:hypothetical protein
MAWEDAAQFLISMTQALDSFDWSTVETISNELSERIRKTPDTFPTAIAESLLGKLRRKQCFRSMATISESLIESGVETPNVQRQYAQSLIDQGLLTPAQSVLRSIVHDPNAGEEEFEARGLIGRIHKQLYVNRNDPSSPANQKNLQRALEEYFYVYQVDRKKHFWHGINVVALTARAQRDGISTTGFPDPTVLAREIRQVIDEKAGSKLDSLPAWYLATRLEACVALGEKMACMNTALFYVVSNDADAFEINSTLRQFTEVWQLNEEEPLGKELLTTLKAGRLRKRGSVVNQDLQQIQGESKKVGAVVSGLESIFGSDRMVTLNWYRKGLDQCTSVARIETPDGRGFGTGWLVKASDFFENRTGILLMTNAHVITDAFDPTELPPVPVMPHQARAKFQALEKEQIYELGEVVWRSPPDGFDATLVTLKTDPPAQPLSISPDPVRMTDPPERLYIIGHPGGRDLEISLQDNYLLGCDQQFIHYRTPTEPGSSGSPVFERTDWQVVGLHHRGGEKMNRLDGQPGTYAANEGIALLAIQKAPK